MPILILRYNRSDIITSLACACVTFTSDVQLIVTENLYIFLAPDISSLQKNKETFTIKIVFRGGLSFPDFSVIIQKDYLYARFPTSISGQSLTKFES